MKNKGLRLYNNLLLILSSSYLVTLLYYYYKEGIFYLGFAKNNILSKNSIVIAFVLILLSLTKILYIRRNHENKDSLSRILFIITIIISSAFLFVFLRVLRLEE